ncbi:MAG: hypothetical protein BGP23_02305 [Lysobacterales bacterium 66-474]|nr:MAG: hypothetical protein ABT18_14395 [Rhodanobacter sp. SCN 66-43]OJY84855.1 MAG: hypothetical protein BGP23_02305 [Xanthomonadales bacterium 66-474]
MLKELIGHFGGTQPHGRNMDDQSTTCGKACEAARPGSNGPRQKISDAAKTAVHRDWRPRLYW